MKTIKTIITALLLLFIINGYAQNKQEVIVMKIQESAALLKNMSYIRISYPDETIKTIELKNVSNYTKMDNEDANANAKTIQKTINSITNENYQIVSSSVSFDSGSNKAMFIIFSRNKKE